MKRGLAHGSTRKDPFFNPRYFLAQGAILASKNYHYQAMRSIHHLNKTRAGMLDSRALHDCIEGARPLRMLDANPPASAEFVYEPLQGCQNSFHKYPSIQRAILWYLSVEDR